MSLLWKNAIAVHTADPRTIATIQNGPREVPVTQAGFKSHVWGTPYSGFWEHTHDPSELGENTRERIWDETQKTPGPQSVDEYGDANTAHDEDHMARADEKMDQEHQRRQNNRNDDLHKFLFNHAANNDFWDRVPSQHVDLSQDIHATQPYVLREHLLRYLHNPNGETDHSQRNLMAPIHRDDKDPDGVQHPYYRTDESRASEHQRQQVADYYGNDAPGFVKHQGKVHAVEGHHRVAAALLRGDTSIHAKMYDADAHGFPEASDEDE